MKTLIKTVCWIVVFPILLLCGVVGFGGIGGAICYGWATDFKDPFGYALVGLCAELIWLLVLIRFIP